jgi:molybdopterin synthase sulfur carrier subunit
MPLKVFLSATLRQYLPDYDPGTGHDLAVPPGATPREVARLLAIPEEDVRLIMVNGISVGWDANLTGDERVAFFPPLGGG